MSGHSHGLVAWHVGMFAPSIQHLVADRVILELDVAPWDIELWTGHPNIVPPSRAEGEAVGMPNQREPARHGAPDTDHECALIHRLSVAPTHIAMTARPAADPDVQPTRVPLITCGAGEAVRHIRSASTHAA